MTTLGYWRGCFLGVTLAGVMFTGNQFNLSGLRLFVCCTRWNSLPFVLRSLHV